MAFLDVTKFDPDTRALADETHELIVEFELVTAFLAQGVRCECAPMSHAEFEVSLAQIVLVGGFHRSCPHICVRVITDLYRVAEALACTGCRGLCP